MISIQNHWGLLHICQTVAMVQKLVVIACSLFESEILPLHPRSLLIAVWSKALIILSSELVLWALSVHGRVLVQGSLHVIILGKVCSILLRDWMDKGLRWILFRQKHWLLERPLSDRRLWLFGRVGLHRYNNYSDKYQSIWFYLYYSIPRLKIYFIIYQMISWELSIGCQAS